MRWRPRPLLLVVLLLLGGGAVTVLVALACAAPGGRNRSDWHEFVRQWGAIYEADREDRRRYGEPVGAVMPIPGSVTDREFGLRVSAVGRERGYALAVDAGWPLPALRYSATYTDGVRQTGGPQWPGAGLFAVSEGGIPTELLPGLAANTLFYAVVMGAIFALPLSAGPIRRRLRARRGRCPKCGYDLAGLGGAEPGAEGAAPCPECGAAR